jgi:hypothetical protein
MNRWSTGLATCRQLEPLSRIIVKPMTTSFTIGNPDGERVQIDVLARSHPNEADYWDGNWVKAEVTVVAGPWHGTFHADLRSEEFDQLRAQMQRLYEDKGPVAELGAKGDNRGALVSSPRRSRRCRP